MKIKLSIQNLMKFCIALFIFYQTYIQNKIISISGFIPILSGVIIILFLLSYFGKLKYQSHRLPRECRLFAIYFLYMALMGMIGSPSIESHLSRCLEMFGYMCLMFSIIHVCQQDNSPNYALAVMYLTALILAVSFIRKPVLLSTGRYSLTELVNPNSLGMSMMVGIWCALSLYRRKRFGIIWTLISILLFFYVMFLSASLKSISAIIIFFVVDYYFSTRKMIIQKKGKGVQLLLDVLIVIMILISVVFFVLRDNSFQNSIVGQRISSIIEGTASDRRIRLYEYAFETFKAHPIFGIGFNGFEYIYSTYSHSTIAEVFVAGGILGGSLYIIIFIMIIIRFLKHYKYSKAIRSNITSDGEALAGMAMMTVLLFVIIHPYEMKSYINYALCICLVYANDELSKEYSIQ